MRPSWRATYRLQLTPELGFEQAALLVPYLARLGVSHLYLSPILEARKGSAHGYDVTDPRSVRAELGGEIAFRALCDAAHAAGLGILVDIVPNHMAASPQSFPFNDVLSNGEASEFAPWFDVDWGKHGADRRIVLPWLDGGGSAPVFVRTANGLELAVGDERLPVRRVTTLPETPEAIAAALASQAYRLVPWRSIGQRNYRRYLDLDHLIGIRVEDRDVFAATHAKILELVRNGCIDGLRIDHLDGLAEPVEYLRTLRAAAGEDVAIFAESTNPADPVPCGTTGYDFLRATVRMFLPESARRESERVYAESRSSPEGRESAIRSACEHVASELLRDEFEAALDRIAAGFPQYSREDIRNAMLDESAGTFGGNARRALEGSPHAARTIRYVRSKAIEDTWFWRDAAVLAERELGFAPAEPPTPERSERSPLHELMSERARGGGISLNATSTHDTKRSEDVRARLVALAPRAERLSAIVAASDADFRRREFLRLDFTDMWFVLSEIIGAWPVARGAPFDHEAFAARIDRHLEKAAREAKMRSSWVTPDPAHERSLQRYARFVIAGPDAPWRREFAELRDDVARDGIRLSLAQVVLKVALPGVADIYQGCESIALHLVDPDNRRPVDFVHRIAELDALEREERAAASRAELVAALLADPSPERLKLFVARECLAWRRDVGDVFDRAASASVRSSDRRDSPILLDRHGESRSMVVLVAPPASLAPGIEATRVQLPAVQVGQFRDRFTHRVFHSNEWYELREITGALGLALLDAGGT